MKYSKIVIAGGTGFLGKVLVNHFLPLSREIVILSRSYKVDEGRLRYVVWDGTSLGPWSAELDGADVLINMAGRTVNCRYTAKNKRDIYESRLASTAVLHRALEVCENPPAIWINSSTATIYRHETESPNTEKDGIIGHGFSVDVAKKWEKAFFDGGNAGVRKVAMRTAIVLGKAGDAFNIYRRHAYMGLSGRHGSGKQMVSWLHELDFARIVEFLIGHKAVEGVVNCCAPHPIPDKAFLAALRKSLGLPFGLPIPAWALKIGAWLIGTETELILKSRWVVPERLVKMGFKFSYPTIEAAFEELTAPDNRKIIEERNLILNM